MTCGAGGGTTVGGIGPLEMTLALALWTIAVIAIEVGGLWDDELLDVGNAEELGLGPAAEPRPSLAFASLTLSHWTETP